MTTKKHVNVSQTSPNKIERVKALHNKGFQAGIANKPLMEPIPSIDIADSERVIQGNNNAFIILGRDRPSHIMSGFGAQGATQAGRIDLIAGIGASYLNEDGQRLPPSEDTVLSPNFAMDGARVYISQKTHLDKYMGLADVDGDSPPGRSGIGLKADTIRMHSRGDIKIVTGRGNFGGLGTDGEPLSTGGRNEVSGKICFIAGNYTGERNVPRFDILKPFGRERSNRSTLQPLILGDNLVQCLSDILTSISRLSRLVGDNQQQIAQISSKLALHTHITPSGPAAPSFSAIASQVQVMTKQLLEKSERQLSLKDLKMINTNYLNINGGDYICSQHVFTT